MRKYRYVLFLTILFVSYQNCAPSNNSTSSDVDKAQSSPEYSQTPLQELNKISFALGDYEHDLFYDQFVDLNLDTGELVPYQNYGGLRCRPLNLDAASAQKLHEILNGASVCEPVVNEKIGQEICTMEYTSPYAILKDEVGHQEFSLGEKRSGCDHPIDLCGDKANEFKKAVQEILAQYRPSIEEACQ